MRSQRAAARSARRRSSWTRLRSKEIVACRNDWLLLKGIDDDSTGFWPEIVADAGLTDYPRKAS